MTTDKENLIANVLYGIAADLDAFGDDRGMRLSIADRARRFATRELGGNDPFDSGLRSPASANDGQS